MLADKNNMFIAKDWRRKKNLIKQPCGCKPAA